MSLLHSDVWHKVVERGKECQLKQWARNKLVSVNGVPLKVQGTGAVYTSFAGASASFETMLLVVDDITVEAILAVNFLGMYGCVRSGAEENQFP